MGQRHLGFLTAAGHEVTEVDTVLGRFDLGRVAGDVDAAVIASPSPIHQEHAMPFIAAGLPVLIEKPVSVSIQDALTIESAANFYKSQVSVGYQERFNHAWRVLMPTLYGFGSLTIIRHSPRPEGQYGTVGMDLASHDIDLLRFAYGDDLSIMPLLITQNVARYAFEAGIGTTGTIDARFLEPGDASTRTWYWHGRQRQMADLANQPVSTLKFEQDAWFDRIAGRRSDVCAIEDAVLNLRDAIGSINERTS